MKIVWKFKILIIASISFIVLIGSFIFFDSEKNRESKIRSTKEDQNRSFRNSELFCENTNENIDSINKGETIYKRFEFENGSSKTIRIIDYEVTCGCTNLFISNQKVKPQNLIYVEMQIDTSYKSIGWHEEHAIIRTNGRRDIYILTIRYNVI